MLSETFLPWDLDSLFVSTMILVLVRFVDSSLSEDSLTWLNKAFGFLDAMTANGNKIAEFRCAELRKLEEMLSEYSTNRISQQQCPAAQPKTSISNHQSIVLDQQPLAEGYFMNQDIHSPQAMINPEGVGVYPVFSDESSGFGDDLTTEQILAVAESMDLDGTDWFNTFATMDNFEAVDPLHPAQTM